jgi:hypothetical protein
VVTNCKLHCGCSDVRCLCSFLDRHVLSDTDALRNPQRQLASYRYRQAKKKKLSDQFCEILKVYFVRMLIFDKKTTDENKEANFKRIQMF